MAPPPSPARAARAAVRRQGVALASPDAALALLVLAVVGMMIVPLPTWLLDGLISLNLSAAVTLLLVVLYVPDALAIATFPTVLLLTTLFRLGLNVSATRLILLHGDAGDVIRAFGTFVVQGNYVVGAIVFLILTIIQFVVIAKGSERVAEVGARFVLDAMPGKQMAIDAELRTGAIDSTEARRRRRTLLRESQFYGAMDGAMKFVKGDVIASLIITAVNIFGGLAIGVGQRGMPVGDALKRYGLLTIGDGLVSQIPALVISTAAGVLVTRVASEESETPLGRELGAQLLGSPKALFAASLFVALLGVVPGLPTLPFLVVAGLLFVASRRATRRLEQARREREANVEVSRDGFAPLVPLWRVELPDESAGALGDVATQLDGVRRDLFLELGLPLPKAVLTLASGLPSGHLAISLRDVPQAIVPAGDLGAATEAIRNLLRRRAGELLGLSETQKLLDELEGVQPATVRAVVPKPVSLTLLTDILRRLVDEGISIRDLSAILQSLSGHAALEKDPLSLAELVRADLRRATTFRLTRGAGHLEVVTLDPTVEDIVRRSVTRTTAGAFLTLAPQAARDIVSAMRRAVAEASASDGRPEGAEPRPIVLTQPDIRRFVRKLVETDLPEVAVVSFADLLPEISVRPAARAHLADLG